MKSANQSQIQSYVYDYVRLQPSEQIGLHTQSTWELNYIVSGHGMRIVGDRQERFEAGEVMLVPPGMPHCWYFDGEDEVIENVCLQISDGWLKSLGQNLPEIYEAVNHIRQIESAVKFCQPASDSISSLMMDMKDGNPLHRLTSLLQICGKIYDEKNIENIGQKTTYNRDEERAKQVDIYVACNYQRDLTLDAIALHIGLSRTAFCRWMRQHMHTTFAAYVLDFRLDKAAEGLCENRFIAVSQIAYQAGFSDVSYFNRMFKRKFGISPKAMRKEIEDCRENFDEASLETVASYRHYEECRTEDGFGYTVGIEEMALL